MRHKTDCGNQLGRIELSQESGPGELVVDDT